MTDKKRFWSQQTKAAFRDALNLRPLTREEAGRELAKARTTPLPDVVVDAIVARAKEIEGESSSKSAPEWTDAVETADIDDELVAMHRNESELSPEVEEKLRLAREALDDNNEDDEAAQ